MSEVREVMATGISEHASALMQDYNGPAALELGKFTARGPLLYFTEYIIFNFQKLAINNT